MKTQMIIRIEDDVKEKVKRLAQVEGKTTSQVVRELIEDYVRERDIGAYIDDLWNRIGTQLRDRGIGPQDIDNSVPQARATRE